MFDPFTAPTRSGIDLERLREAVATITPGEADCAAVPALAVEGVTVVDPPADLDDPNAELTVAEVARIAGGCLIVEHVALAGRTVTQVRDLLASDASVHAVSEPVRGLRLDHDSDAHKHTGDHHTDTGDAADEQWHLPHPTMQDLWDGWDRDADAQVIVAVLDTGVDITHPDFTENEGGPSADDTHERVVDGVGCHIVDDNGHGTQMAGIIAAELGGGHVAGVAPQARILPLRTLDRTSCTDTAERLAPMMPPVAIAEAVNDGARVINMSFRGSARRDASGIEVGGVGIPSNDTYELALRAATMLGVVAVAAAGNCGDDDDDDKDGIPNWQEEEDEGGEDCPEHNASERPAIYGDVVAVAGIKRDGVRIDVSSANEHVDVAAPGDMILTTQRFRTTEPSCTAADCVGESGGTSAAAAYVSGVVAHMLNRHPHATPGQVQRALEATASHPRGVGRDDGYGHGVVDPDGAVSGLGAILGLRVPSGPLGGFVAVSSGAAHSCGLRSNGAVQCWGAAVVSDDVPGFAFESVSSPPTADFVCGVRRGDQAVLCWGDVPSGVATVAGSGAVGAPEGRFVQVAVGESHVCGVRPDGRVVCWGDNSSDQTDVPFGRFSGSGGEPVSKVVAGSDHTCAITDASDVVCWGDDSEGQLPPSSLPFAVRDVAAGASHTCVVSTGLAVSCYGDNTDGQLDGPAGDFANVWAGADHTCARGLPGWALSCWGDSGDGRLVAPAEPFIEVSAGESHGCGVLADATVSCWGDNTGGQAPRGRLASLSFTADGADLLDGVFDADVTDYEVAAFAGTVTVGWAVDGASAGDADPQVTVSVVNTGGSSSLTGSAVADHAVFVRDGSVVTVNVVAPFDGVVTRSYTIRVVARPQLAALSVRRLASGADCPGEGCPPYVLVPAFDSAVTAYSVVVPPDVDEVTVAYSAADAADSVSVSPTDASDGSDGSAGHQVALTTNTGFVSMDVGSDHSCGLSAGGVARCWGGSSYLGQSRVPSGSYASVSAGWGHTCAITTAGAARCWGDNYWGQSRPPGGSFASVSAGGGHSCGLTASGTVRCWGYDFSGQSSPPSGTFTAVAAGGNHSCGITAAGTLSCWGLNNSGESSPPSGTFTALSTSWRHNCAIATDSTVSCWGNSGSGRTSAPSGTFIAVSAGHEHSCGVKTDNTAVCWGNDGSGRATAPSGSFTAVSAGEEHSCGLTTAGTVLCWGAAIPATQPAAPATITVSVTSGTDTALTTAYTVSIQRTVSQQAGGASSSARPDSPAGRGLIDEKLAGSTTTGRSADASQCAMPLPPETPVPVSDPVLRAALERALNKLAGQTITAAEMVSLTALRVPRAPDAPSSAVTNLTGLQHATALEALDIAGHDIADLAPLRCVTSLKVLNVARNQISDIAALSSLTSLERLHLYDNQISDIAALSSLTSLTALYLDHNQITGIAALSSLTGLTTLGLGDNQITDITALSGLTALETLYIFDNDIADAAALSSLNNLSTLWVDGNDLASPHGWAPAGGLGYLDVRHNLIADIAPLDALAATGGTIHSEPQRVATVRVNDASLRAALLAALGKTTGATLSPAEIATIERLERVGPASDPAPIADLSGLEHATALRVLRLRNNNIADIGPVSGLARLTELDLHTNRVSDLAQLRGLASLETLSLVDNNITSLDTLPALPRLESLFVDLNHIRDLTPLAPRTTLAHLGLVGNDITDIAPLAGLTGLESLSLSLNNITDISPLAGLGSLRALRLEFTGTSDLEPLRRLTALRFLHLGNNRITSLEPLRALEALWTLDVQNNNVTSLEPLTQHTGLRNLYITGNRITSLEPLRTYTSLRRLHLGGNRITDFTPVENIAGLTIHGRNDQNTPS